jgi:hypothetical protein
MNLSKSMVLHGYMLIYGFYSVIVIDPYYKHYQRHYYPTPLYRTTLVQFEMMS